METEGVIGAVQREEEMDLPTCQRKDKDLTWRLVSFQLTRASPEH